MDTAEMSSPDEPSASATGGGERLQRSRPSRGQLNIRVSAGQWSGQPARPLRSRGPPPPCLMFHNSCVCAICPQDANVALWPPVPATVGQPESRVPFSSGLWTVKVVLHRVYFTGSEKNEQTADRDRKLSETEDS
ncbi:hypothetical protein J6590_007367 [Homalodisca vitripennis]|nr:hypothetical protein J6590_007367 [Homalodisca vitripennis]